MWGRNRDGDGGGRNGGDDGGALQGADGRGGARLVRPRVVREPGRRGEVLARGAEGGVDVTPTSTRAIHSAAIALRIAQPCFCFLLVTTNFESRNLDVQIHCSYTKHNCLRSKLNHDIDLQNYLISTKK